MPPPSKSEIVDRIMRMLQDLSEEDVLVDHTLRYDFSNAIGEVMHCLSAETLDMGDLLAATHALGDEVERAAMEVKALEGVYLRMWRLVLRAKAGEDIVEASIVE